MSEWLERVNRFGQEFCDAIQNEWGGKPYRDLVAGVQYVRKAYPEIDGERMATLGISQPFLHVFLFFLIFGLLIFLLPDNYASYGGFMVNWMQGHNDSLGMKCFVCHDGGKFSLSLSLPSLPFSLPF